MHATRPHAMLLLAALAVTTACATTGMAVRTGKEMAALGRDAYRDEPDLELARVSGYASLKMIETLWRAEPDDTDLALALAEGFAAAALLFAEEDVVAARCAGDEIALDASLARVKSFYTRARVYAVRALEPRVAGIRAALADPPARLRAWLDRHTSAVDAPALLWLAVGTLGSIGAEVEDTPSPSELGRVRAVLERVVTLDAGLRYGTPHLALAALDASSPRRMSPSPDRGASSFERALAVTSGRFLLARVERARTLWVAEGERARFVSELESVLESAPDVLPGERLLTAAAQRRARRLLAATAALFAGSAGSVGAYHQVPCER